MANAENTDNTVLDDVKNVAGSDDIREKVRVITLKALSERQLDKDSINIVVKSVIAGVTEGVGESSEKLKPQLKASLSGFDDALSKSAIAVKLATEEAIGRAEQFAEKDLKKAMDEFKGLEESFIDTINSVAKGSSTVASSALNEIAEHFKNTGTNAGKEALNAVNSLGEALLGAGKGTIDEIASATQTASGHFSNIVGGVLSGMADAVASGAKNVKPQNANVKDNE